MMSSPRLVALGVVIAGLAVLGFLLNRWFGIGTKRRAIERKRLLTPTEIRFWRVLVAAVPDYAVFSQVAMGALLKPISGLSPAERMSNRGRFSQKIVDFVIVDPKTADVVAVVELDDKTHNAERDAERDRLMAYGGYDVVRIHVTDRLDARALRARLFGVGGPSNVTPIGQSRVAL